VNSIKLGFGPCVDDTHGEEAIEQALKVANSENPTRVILLGDAAPHPHKKGTPLRVTNDYTITMETDYREECMKLRDKSVQVSAYYFSQVKFQQAGKGCLV
jgi:predicted phosphodiesterase